MSDYKGIKNFDELIEREHGKIGTECSIIYEENAQLFIVSEMLEETQSSKADCCDELSLAEFNQIIDDSEEDAANGRVKGIKELDKDIDSWI
jgi:hypothetical protein